MTPMEDFQDLLPSMPDASRVWMFGAQRFLTPDEANHLQAEMSHFVSGWQAHGKDLLAGFGLLLNNVLVVAVDESKEPPSGCSIDKVFKLLKSQQEKNGLDFFQRTLIWARVESDLCIYNGESLLQAFHQGDVNFDTPVVNMLAPTLGDLRNAGWIALNDSWIAKKIAREIQST